jgi:hypothetical protein
MVVRLSTLSQALVLSKHYLTGLQQA